MEYIGGGTVPPGGNNLEEGPLEGTTVRSEAKEVEEFEESSEVARSLSDGLDGRASFIGSSFEDTTS